MESVQSFAGIFTWLITGKDNNIILQPKIFFDKINFFEDGLCFRKEKKGFSPDKIKGSTNTASLKIKLLLSTMPFFLTQNPQLLYALC